MKCFKFCCIFGNETIYVCPGQHKNRPGHLLWKKVDFATALFSTQTSTKLETHTFQVIYGQIEG